MGFQKQPLRLQLYLLAYLPALGLVLGAVLHQPGPHDWPLVGLLLLATAATACCKLELTIFQARMSLVFAIGCLALLLEGAQAAVLCAAIGALVTSLVRAPGPSSRPCLQRQPLHRLLFNVALCAVSCGIAALAFGAVLAAAPRGEGGRLCALIAFGGAYFLVNGAGLALALAFQQGLRPFAVWRDNLLPMAPGFFASALAAWAVSLAVAALGVWALLFLLPLYLVYYSYWVYLGQLRRAEAEREALIRSQAARVEAEAGRRRMGFLAEASAVLASSLDYHATLPELARLTTPYLADLCQVYLLDEEGLHLVAEAGGPELQEAGATASCPGPAVAWGDDHPVHRALLTGQAEARSGLLTDLLPDPASALHGVSSPSPSGDLLCLPLRTGQHTLGVLVLFTGQGREEELSGRAALAEELARRVALSVDNARLYRQVQEEDRRKDLFLALLGHELRNPLAAMRNALEVLRLRELGPAEAGGYLEILHRQVGRQSRLIDDLLDVSRINQGKLQLRTEAVELGTLASHLAVDLRPQAEERGLELRITPSQQQLWVEADPTRLEQVLSNLLTNALRYNRPGGRICFSWAEEEGEAVVRVRDTGVGIPGAMLPRIFDPFAQVESATRRAPGGLGLGLSLVRSLVELHGGQVRAYSDGPEQGAEFVIRLPLRPQPGEPLRQEPGAGNEGRREVSLDILIADDNEDAAVSLGEVLQFWGHRVQVARGGVEALKFAGDRPWDALLLDIGMPDLDGYAVARKLRDRPEGRRLFLVALTGYGQRQDVESALAAGFDTHLTKPASFEALRTALDQAAERKQSPGSPGPSERASGLVGPG